MGRTFITLLAFCLFLLPGCSERATEPVEETAVAAPDWIAEILDTDMGEAGAEAARARLFAGTTDGEVFAGLVAFAGAKDPELRRIAAFHLASMAPVADKCGVPVEATLQALAEDEDEHIRQLSAPGRYPHLEGTDATAIDSGEAVLGEECSIPFSCLPGVDIYLLINGVEHGSGPALASIDSRVQARLGDGALLGESGGRYQPNLTGGSFMGIGTDDAQYGYDIWLRVLEGDRVRWWLRGLSKGFPQDD